jgi:uncharacterized protein
MVTRAVEIQRNADSVGPAAGIWGPQGLEFSIVYFQGSPSMSFAEQLHRLQAFLDADELHDEALDYVAAHGYLTALSICSEVVPDREWIDALFAEPPHYTDKAQHEEIESTLVHLKNHIARQLASEEELELPCDLDLGDDPDDSELRGWCIGFMEGVFLREAAWFETAEEEVSEMLLPIMVGSGLFDEQPEFEDIAADANLMDDMIVQIPEALSALFLLCQAPDEKPAILKPRHH